MKTNKQSIKITDVKIQDNTIKDVVIQTGQHLTSKQVAKKIDDGQDVTYKRNEIQSIKGKYIRSKPNETTKDNLKPN
jgi:hydroxymethylpyrimidine/phosphomethylpyrimidine kinase